MNEPHVPLQGLLEDLLNVLTLERLELDLFRGISRDIGSPQVFGGQVLGQALMAASGTVEDRVVHSLHAYFLRRGDFKAPIVYEVDRARDGNHFSMRRVVAIQHGAQIFNMAASFQERESGLDHQIDMPDVPAPESLLDLAEAYREVLPHMPPRLRRVLERQGPFEFRPVEILSGAPRKRAARKHMWFKAIARLPDEEALHRCLLAYVSDFHLLDTALLPHNLNLAMPNLVMASIDHAMWFHRRVRVDEWLLYATDSPSASEARGFSRGSIFTRDGNLVASTAQEGLMRVLSREQAKGAP
ncbi:MAG TPA: acyl-CoA thioesterase II [Steroidobacteraceae bacterium]|nr:acyl-CoA thioesterase II [Steroidobacteraceae bacterium]